MGYGRYFEGRATGGRHSQCKGPEVEKEPQGIRTGQAEEPGNTGDEVKEVFVSQRHFINPSVMVNTGCQSDRLSPGDKSLGVSVKRFLDWAIEVGRPRKCGRHHSKFLACIKRRRELPAS